MAFFAGHNQNRFFTPCAAKQHLWKAPILFLPHARWITCHNILKMR